MSLPPPAPRRHLHTRTILCQGFEREDGLFDIEAHIVDTKPIPVEFSEGRRVEPGTPFHDMELRLTVDDKLTVRDVEVTTHSAPHAVCSTVAPAYKELVGANLGRGFRRAVEQAVGGTKGCTHLRELLLPAATVAFQTLAGKPEHIRKFWNKDPDPDAPLPFFVNSCKAWAQDGEAVKKFYPMYYKRKEQA